MRAILPNVSNTSLQYQLCENGEIHKLYALLISHTYHMCITSDEISKKARYEETVHYFNLTTG